MWCDGNHLTIIRPVLAELLFQDKGCQNGDVHHLNRNIKRWCTCWRYWLCRKVFTLKRSREEVLLSILVSETDFNKRYVSTRDYTYCRRRDVASDIQSPALLIPSGKRDER